MRVHKNSYWVKSGFYSMGSRVFVLLFGFGSFFILVRHLSKEEFGTWAIFLTISSIIEMSRNGLIQNALIKLVHSHETNEEIKILTATWFLNIVYTIIIFLLLLFLSGFAAIIFRSHEIESMFLYYGLTLFLLIPFSQFNYIQQAKFSFSGIFWGAFVRYGTFFILNALVYIYSIRITLNELVLMQASSTFLGLLISFLLAKRYLAYKFEWHYVSIKKVFTFGKYVMGTNLCSLIFKSTDQFSIGYFLNTSYVASYNAAIRLSNLIEYPTTSIAEIVYPKSTAQYEKDGELSSKYMFERSVGITLGITLPIVLFVLIFANIIIKIIAGDAYSDSADILRLTILFGLFTPFSRQFGTALDSSGRPHLNFYLLILSVLINIILNIIGIHFFGILGACYGTLTSYIIIFFINNHFMKRIFNIEKKEVLKNMVQFYKMIFLEARKYLKISGNG